MAALAIALFPCLGSATPANPPEVFLKALPGYAWQFPRDHGAHPDYRTEWWYYTGHLFSSQGERFGYQLTFFRVALARPDPAVRSAWTAHTVYFAHLAVTDVAGQTFAYREKAQRGALGLAGAATHRLQVWVDDWRAEARGDSHRLLALAAGVGLDLTLTPAKPPVFHGDGGFSRKAAGTDHASQYYSISRLTTQGTLTLNGREVKVQGESWLDREFSTSQLAPHQAGWDWFALQLEEGSDLMLYQLRLKDGGLDAASAGSFIDPQGRAQPLSHNDFTVKATAHWRSPKSGARYPAAWEITVPSLALTLTLTPTLPDQELQTKASTQVTYWEGQVAIRGVKNGAPLAGLGYVELTGYAGPLGGRF